MQWGLMKEMKNRWTYKIRCTKQSEVQQRLRLEQVGDMHGSDTADLSLVC